MKRSLFLCLWLALSPSALPASGAPPEVPATLQVKTGKPVIFDVKADGGKPFSYALGFDKSKCTVVRLYSDDPAIASFMAIPDEDGDFLVIFWTRGDKETGYARLTITAGGGTDPAPNPADGKRPTDAFTTSIRTAYLADVKADPTARTTAVKLAALYRAAAKTTTQDFSVATNGDLFDDMEAARESLKIPSANLALTREQIGIRLSGTDAKPGTLRGRKSPLNRRLAQDELNAVALALEWAVK